MDPVWSSRAFYGGPNGPNHGSPRGLLDLEDWQIEYVEEPSPTITLDEHVAAVLGSPAACRNVLRQLRARHEKGELRDAKWSSVNEELERLRSPSRRQPDG